MIRLTKNVFLILSLLITNANIIATCHLTKVNGPNVNNNFSVPGNYPFDGVFSPDGKCLISINRLSNDITVFKVDNCFLTQLKTGEKPNGNYSTGGVKPRNAIFTHDGSYLFVSNSDSNDIAIFKVKADCSLNRLKNGNKTNGNYPTGGLTPTGLKISNDDSYLLVSNVGLFNTPQYNNGNLVTFKINKSTNNLTLSNHKTIETYGDSPFSTTFDQTGNYLVATNCNSNNIVLFKVEENLSTTLLGIFPTAGSFPTTAEFSPNNNCLGVINSGSNPLSDPGTVSMFKFIPNEDNYTLVKEKNYLTGSWYPQSGRFNNGGTCFFTINSPFLSNATTGSLSVFQVNKPNNKNNKCTLSNLKQYLSGGKGQAGFAISDNCIAVFNSGSNDITQFKISNSSNSLEKNNTSNC